MKKVNFEISTDKIINISDMFKLFADSTRLSIICSLMGKEQCVCDICQILDLNQSTVSHQLKLLRSAKLVKSRRDGKHIFYSLKDNHVENVIKLAIEHISEKEDSYNGKR